MEQATLWAPDVRFGAIVMDPAWPERGGGKIKRGADRHYPLGSKEELLAAIRGSGLFLPADDAHLWCWATTTAVANGSLHWLVEQLGFRLVRDFPWVKTGSVEGDEMPEDADEGELRMGIGQYARGCHETLFLAVRGRGQSPTVWTGDRSVRSVILAPQVRGADGKVIHSRKPDESYRRIERVSRGPFLEMFARRRWRPDWMVWGYDAPQPSESV